jgi:transposase
MLMETKTAGKRDFSALERRRLKAARLLKRGLRPAEVARRLGVHRQSVGRWQQHLDREGLAGLKKAGRAGRPAKMRVEQLLRLEEELVRGPRAWGYTTELWTTQRVADLIQRRFRVRYHRDHVGRVLAQMGWSCQRPVGRAKERNEARIRRWKRVAWPRIKKKPSS